MHCFSQICRRRKVKDGIDEVRLRFGPCEPLESTGRISLDADRAHSDGVYNAKEGPNTHMRRALYNITFDVVLYSYIVQ